METPSPDTFATGFHNLWPTPIGLHRFAEAEELNPLFVRVLGAMRAAQLHQRGQAAGAFFASDDDLLQRVKLPEWERFVRFVVDSIGETVGNANRHAWPDQKLDLQVSIEGMWFQFSRGGAFHDVHTHGNCSWSGIYIVQIDAHEKRILHPVYGAANGVTRLYGLPFATLGGAFIDAGNAYLQPPSVDIDPMPGRLLIFPAWLAHQAMPYGGEVERLIISFNASIHARGGDKLHGYSAY